MITPIEVEAWINRSFPITIPTCEMRSPPVLKKTRSPGRSADLATSLPPCHAYMSREERGRSREVWRKQYDTYPLQSKHSGVVPLEQYDAPSRDSAVRRTSSIRASPVFSIFDDVEHAARTLAAITSTQAVRTFMPCPSVGTTCWPRSTT